MAEAEAESEYNDLRGYSVDYFKGELKLSEADSILFSVCDGDPVKSQKSKVKIKRKIILDYHYQKRVSRLNELRTGIEQLKHIEKTNN